MPNSNLFGSYVPTTNIWDVSNLSSVDVNSPEFKELIVRLYQNVNAIALVLNSKDTGIYDLSEFVNGQVWFPNPNVPVGGAVSSNFRNNFRTVVNMGPLQNPLTTQPHNINCDLNTSFTRIYGVASDPIGLTYIPLPYVDVGGPFNIQLLVDHNNVNIITASDRTMYTICYVVLEYLLT